MAPRLAPDDSILKRVIPDSRSFEDASKRLGLSKTCVRTHADRLGIRTAFHYGVERLPKSENVLKQMFKETRKKRGLAALARRLGVTRQLLAEESDRVGVDGRRAVRKDLPDDATLRADMLACESFAALALQYGVRDYVVRNQAKRLGVPAPMNQVDPVVNRSVHSVRVQ